MPIDSATITVDLDASTGEPPYVLTVRYSDPPDVACAYFSSLDAAERARDRLLTRSTPREEDSACPRHP